MSHKLKPYPVWVCYDCGITASMGRKLHEYATYHPDTCDVCGQDKACTEPRDFQYPDFPGHEPVAKVLDRWEKKFRRDNPEMATWLDCMTAMAQANGEYDDTRPNPMIRKEKP